jgi:hypothetical protein
MRTLSVLSRLKAALFVYNFDLLVDPLAGESIDRHMHLLIYHCSPSTMKCDGSLGACDSKDRFKSPKRVGQPRVLIESVVHRRKKHAWANNFH